MAYHKRRRSADRAMHRYISVTAVVSTVFTADRMEPQGLQETTGAASIRRLGGPNSAFFHDAYMTGRYVDGT